MVKLMLALRTETGEPELQFANRECEREVLIPALPMMPGEYGGYSKAGARQYLRSALRVYIDKALNEMFPI